jgi:CBS-domain-containing membrane protein
LEKWVSAAGGLVGIWLVMLISEQFLSPPAVNWVVASMGATAVLLFAVPHGPLSQPWAVIGGHTVSAAIGVLCARWIPDMPIAAAAAVALSIGVMHYLRCIHPPGGATALSAVIGGEGIHLLGFQFVFAPVLLNAVTIVIVAVMFNYTFSWRRYPASLSVRDARMPVNYDSSDNLNEHDLETALQAMNSTIDVSSQDLAHIYRLARQNKLTEKLKSAELELGHYYSNGLFGEGWQVRQIIDMATPAETSNPEDLLIYKVVAGSGRRSTDTISFNSFANWASYEVFLNENSWQRKTV